MMKAIPPSHLRDLLRDYYTQDRAAKAFFDLSAGRVKDASVTSVDRISALCHTDRRLAFSFIRTLEAIDCGRVIKGRGKRKTRISWRYSLLALSQAAQGLPEA